jgi:hypothetical protein
MERDTAKSPDIYRALGDIAAGHIEEALTIFDFIGAV